MIKQHLRNGRFTFLRRDFTNTSVTANTCETPLMPPPPSMQAKKITMGIYTFQCQTSLCEQYQNTTNGVYQKTSPFSIYQTHSSIDHRNYFQTSKGHVTWII